MPVRDLNVSRKTFLAEAGLKDFTELGHLTERDFCEMNRLFPDDMAHLTIDLVGQVRSLTARLHLSQKKLDEQKNNTNTTVLV